MMMLRMALTPSHIFVTTALEFPTWECEGASPTAAQPRSAASSPVQTMPSPRRHKTRLRAAGGPLARDLLSTRTNSLRDSKVLLSTDLRRSESVVVPGLFQFHAHFEYLQVIGRTARSEVCGTVQLGFC